MRKIVLFENQIFTISLATNFCIFKPDLSFYYDVQSKSTCSLLKMLVYDELLINNWNTPSKDSAVSVVRWTSVFTSFGCMTVCLLYCISVAFFTAPWKGPLQLWFSDCIRSLYWCAFFNFHVFIIPPWISELWMDFKFKGVYTSILKKSLNHIKIFKNQFLTPKRPLNISKQILTNFRIYFALSRSKILLWLYCIFFLIGFRDIHKDLSLNG